LCYLAILRSALFRAGLTQETLQTLLADESDYISNARPTGDNPASSVTSPWSTPAVTPGIGQKSYFSGLRRKPPSQNTLSFHVNDDSESPNDIFTERETNQTDFMDDKSSIAGAVPRQIQRTIFLSNLPDRTTHKDITNAVRGGRLLDIHLRQDHSASISFVEGASDFMAHAKRHGLYIKSKRVDVRWNERQFHLPVHVANKIAKGASRNLIIRNAASRLTEAKIRDDLDHIHNLVIVEVRFKANDVVIATNSVHNALFARTCMMSRMPYRGLRIDWEPDECASPLTKPGLISVAKPAPKNTKSTLLVKPNIYDLLEMDPAEASSDEESTQGVPVGPPLRWEDTALVA
jgi:hypothetical protein